MNTTRVLKEKIQRNDVTVAIIGLGYVGLPLAICLARAGVRVIGVDTDPQRVAALEAGQSYIRDVPSTSLVPLVQAGWLAATTDYAACGAADAIIICVPTPFTRMKAPDLSYIEAACRAITPHLHPGMVVVLQSTTYPGTTEELVRPLLE